MYTLKLDALLAYYFRTGVNPPLALDELRKLIIDLTEKMFPVYIDDSNLEDDVDAFTYFGFNEENDIICIRDYDIEEFGVVLPTRILRGLAGL